MKGLTGAVAIAVALSVPGNASASANANASSSFSGGGGAHHGGSTTSAPTAHFSAIPHHPGTLGYRPVVNYSHGNRTLNYPAVGVSTLRHSMPEGGGKLNSAYTLQRNPNSHPNSGPT